MLDESVVVLDGARIVGDVTVGARSSIWYNAVVRADMAAVRIGRDTNLQDAVIVHSNAGCDVTLGDGVSVGHGAILHGCSIADNTVIGMGAIVMDGASVGRDCIVGAGALVTHGTQVPDGHLALGSPARVVRALTPDEIVANRANAAAYVRLAQESLSQGR